MRNTPAGKSEGVECQLGSDNAPYTPNQPDAQTAVGPHFVIEKIVAYRVRVEPDRALEPYASGASEVFTTHMAAAHAAKEAGEGWSLPVIDLTGER